MTAPPLRTVAEIGLEFLLVAILQSSPRVKPARPELKRRDFLRLGRTDGDGAQSSSEGGSREHITVTRPAMGSYFEIRLPAITPGAIDLATRALDLIDELEAQLTVYNDDSEVSRLNACGHHGPVNLEPGLFALLERAVEISRETGGAYEITAGALSEAWGFVRGPKRIPDPETLADARARTGFHHLRFDSERKTVCFDRAGVCINLGSIGKGYAIDRAVDLIRRHWWSTSGLVHGGRSSVYAIGSPPGRLGGRWEIAVRNPLEPENPLGVVRLRNRALGTSGSAFQRFELSGQVYGHIIDPRTGAPAASAPASVTVLAPTAAEADALSTAFSLLDHQEIARYIDSHPEIGVILVEAAECGAMARVKTLGLSPHDFVAASLEQSRTSD